MTPCTATHGDLRCCRTDAGNGTWRQAHPMPHMACNGQQWDENGLRQARGNDPYRGEVA